MSPTCLLRALAEKGLSFRSLLPVYSVKAKLAKLSANEVSTYMKCVSRSRVYCWFMTYHHEGDQYVCVTQPPSILGM